MNHKKSIVYMFLLLMVLSGHQLSAQNRRLFLMQEGGKFGYINRTGKVIIPARFHGAKDFEESLAVALSDINLKPTRDDPYFVFKSDGQDNAQEEKEDEPVVYYSNEFEGTINPGQTIPQLVPFPNVELPAAIFEKLRSQTN